MENYDDYQKYNGFKFFRLNGKFHRLDGPAITSKYSSHWYLNGEMILCHSQEEFERILKLKAFL
jgi:hypothetical protein